MGKEFHYFIGRWQLGLELSEDDESLSSFFLMRIDEGNDKKGLTGERYDRYGLAEVTHFSLLPSGEVSFRVRYNPHLSRGGSDYEIFYEGKRCSEIQQETSYEGCWNESGSKRKGRFQLEQILKPGNVLLGLLNQKEKNPLAKSSV